jgi:hypothetical protein
MHRRGFLKAIGIGAAAVAAGDLLNLVSAPAARTISTSHWHGTGDPFAVGDVFTIDGRYALNPITRQPTRHLQQWVVTRVDSSGLSASPAPRVPYLTDRWDPPTTGARHDGMDPRPNRPRRLRELRPADSARPADADVRADGAHAPAQTVRRLRRWRAPRRPRAVADADPEG